LTDLPLTIVADENIPALESLFGHLGTLRTCAGRNMRPEQVQDADVLLVRSVTRVDASLLTGSRVRFVGTATIGTDHVDQAWLEQQGIGFSSAPGCNADSVVDYVLAALTQIAAEDRFDLRRKKIGIVGVGNVGRRLQRRLDALGLDLLLCDPPRQASESGLEHFVDLETLLEQADIICLHTPLTRTGRWPTHHLLNAERLQRLRPDVLLLNAGRGPVIDNAALLALARQRPQMALVMDVWEHEPLVDPELVALCRIATPHIAGYALDGKIRGTWMLYQALCRQLSRPPAIELSEVLPPAPAQRLHLHLPDDPCVPVRTVYDIYRDDRAFRRLMSGDESQIRQGFDQLRRDYPERREFATLMLQGRVSPSLSHQLAAYGFDCQWEKV